jgi:regulator of sirC expression with transglutaminase-like and TPR domain
LPYEAEVAVRLDDESGAAGLIFAAAGADKHYGFYPSGGHLRLTHFDGPDVYSWHILNESVSEYYRPRNWNTLRVRVEKDKIRCFVNGQPVCEQAVSALTGGKVGLAKFRDTSAEFRHFQVAGTLPRSDVTPAASTRITKALEALRPTGEFTPEQMARFAAEAPASISVLRDRALDLERQAARLRRLAAAVHRQRVQEELARTVQGKEDDIDLARAALQIAKLDNDEVEVDAYCSEVARMGRELSARLPPRADDKARLQALNQYFFGDRAFHGSRNDYYNRANSYLNEVLDDREGLPITLSVLYLELARRIGLTMVGVGLPGHFVVRYLPAKGESQLIDVYEDGKILTRADAEKRVLEMARRPLDDKDLEAVSKRAIIIRMVHNLLGIARAERDSDGMLRYLDTILVLAPDSAEERMARALLRFETGLRQAARADADWLLEHPPAGLDVDRLREFRRMVDRPER